MEHTAAVMKKSAFASECPYLILAAAWGRRQLAGRKIRAAAHLTGQPPRRKHSVAEQSNYSGEEIRTGQPGP